MRPVLFELGPLEIKAYGTFIALASSPPGWCCAASSIAAPRAATSRATSSPRQRIYYAGS